MAKNIVHYGELDSKISNESEAEESHVNVSNEYMELEHQTIDINQQKLEEQMEKKKRARKLNIPTDLIEIISWLRKCGQPGTLFGEERLDRRERLRLILVNFQDWSFLESKEEAVVKEKKREAQKIRETWYHEGSENLVKSRSWITSYSLPRSQARIASQKEESILPAANKIVRMQEVQKDVSSFTAIASQIAGTRPIPFCDFSPNSKMLATCSWSGLCNIWNVPDCTLKKTYRGHSLNASCIKWHPFASTSQSEKSLNLASCAVDGSVYLWNMVDDTPMAQLDGYELRVPRLSFHPSGRFLATSSFDYPFSWRLWDLVALEEILYQEGHSREVFCVEFNHDGSLCASGGLDAYGRLWDLRTGKCVMFLQGHTRAILSVDFNINGYQVVTASQDNTCKIWDIRKRSNIYTIPAHSQLVSSCKFQPNHGKYLATSSYDSTCKMWTHPGWAPLKTLTGHDNRVMCVALSGNNEYIATTSYDKKFKLWTMEKNQDEEMKDVGPS